MTIPGSSKPLSDRLSKRLLAYAAVAGAGSLACAAGAEAEIVYTPTHADIHGNYYIDLNHDGINDFHIESSYLSGIGDLEVLPVIPINKVAAVHQGCLGFYGAAPLALGAVIGSGMKFENNAKCMAQMNSWQSIGPWVGVQDRYLGFKFYIDGEAHYGWARLTFDSFFCFGCIARIFGYAYETVPGKAIIAGDEGTPEEASATPPMLGALALGAPGLSIWRRQEESEAAALAE